jgi:hypothetical protein
METRLRLLTREGAIGFKFTPRLTADQYAELLKASALADNRAELRDAAKQLAIKWQSELEVEEP